MATYFLINFGIGAVAGLAFLIIKIATKPKLCDNCKRLRKKGGGGFWKYECRDAYGDFREFKRQPVYCKDYDPKEF